MLQQLRNETELESSIVLTITVTSYVKVFRVKNRFYENVNFNRGSRSSLIEEV